MFTKEPGNLEECDQYGLKKLQAMQPYVTGLIWHRMKSASEVLLVLTFQLVDFSLRVTLEGRINCVSLLSPFTLSPVACCPWVPRFSREAKCCHVCVTFSSGSAQVPRFTSAWPRCGVWVTLTVPQPPDLLSPLLLDLSLKNLLVKRCKT